MIGNPIKRLPGKQRYYRRRRCFYYSLGCYWATAYVLPLFSGWFLPAPSAMIGSAAAALSSSSSSSSSKTNNRRPFFQPIPYTPPSWCTPYLKNVPKHGRLLLANLPTPLYRIDDGVVASVLSDTDDTSSIHLDFNLYVKRDDCTGGIELGGNKIRKLEFLLADALEQNYDSVVTIGGIQSNHCRATAAASRQVGLEPHLILRTKNADRDNDLGLTGNLLVDRILHSHIYTCTPGEYGRIGSKQLVARLCHHLESERGQNPYAIPVGGSNGLGSWGYIQGVHELLEQWDQMMSGQDVTKTNSNIDHIVFACGSGGTAAGITLGIALAFQYAQQRLDDNPPIVHAIGVCDNPEYFYKFVADIADQMGLDVSDIEMTTEEYIRKHLICHQGKGLGYALCTEEELEFVSKFAKHTGIVLDPVYSGKALYHFFNHVVRTDPDLYRGKNILFWHTGGALGLYDKSDMLLPKLQQSSSAPQCTRLDVYGKGNIGIDVSTDI